MSHVPVADLPDAQHVRETIGSAGRHDDVAILGDVGDGRPVPCAHLSEPFLPGCGGRIAARAGSVEGAGVFFAHEDPVVGLGVVAAEAVEVDLRGTSGHGAEDGPWVVDGVCLVRGKDTMCLL